MNPEATVHTISFPSDHAWRSARTGGQNLLIPSTSLFQIKNSTPPLLCNHLSLSVEIKACKTIRLGKYSTIQFQKSRFSFEPEYGDNIYTLTEVTIFVFKTYSCDDIAIYKWLFQ